MYHSDLCRYTSCNMNQLSIAPVIPHKKQAQNLSKRVIVSISLAQSLQVGDVSWAQVDSSGLS